MALQSFRSSATDPQSDCEPAPLGEGYPGCKFIALVDSATGGFLPREVLVLCGAAGTGKTAALWEVGHILRAHGVPRASIDTDELDRVWPPPKTTEALISISRRILRSIWETFAGLEIRYRAVWRDGFTRSKPRNGSRTLSPGAAITFVRLSAEQSTRAQRLRDREAGSGFDQEMEASDRAARISRITMSLDYLWSLRIEGQRMKWLPRCSISRTG
jgi:hypothetical protein